MENRLKAFSDLNASRRVDESWGRCEEWFDRDPDDPESGFGILLPRRPWRSIRAGMTALGREYELGGFNVIRVNPGLFSISLHYDAGLAARLALVVSILPDESGAFRVWGCTGYDLFLPHDLSRHERFRSFAAHALELQEMFGGELFVGPDTGTEDLEVTAESPWVRL